MDSIWVVTYGMLLLIHYIVVHLTSENPAFAKEPSLLGFTDVVAELHEVMCFGNSVQIGQAPANFFVHSFEYFWLKLLVEIVMTEALQGCDGLVLGKVGHGNDFHSRCVPLQALVYPVLIAVEHFTEVSITGMEK